MTRLLAVLLGLAVACSACGDDTSSTDDGGEVETGADGDADGDADADADAEAGADADADADADAGADADVDADGDADGGADVGSGTWVDPTSGLMWQDPPDETRRVWDDAVAFCDALSLGGQDDWRLPTLDESRSFIRGCAATMTGGACGLTDSCLASSCRSSSCSGCTFRAGPGVDGCYWDPAVSGSCDFYWTSSSDAESDLNGWLIHFTTGSVAISGKALPFYFRCVRDGP